MPLSWNFFIVKSLHLNVLMRLHGFVDIMDIYLGDTVLLGHTIWTLIHGHWSDKL